MLHEWRSLLQITSQEEREVAAMALGERSLGLCLTCNSNPVCTRRKNIRFPVLMCEEFDDSTPLEVARPAAPVAEEKEVAIDVTMGLCCDCANRDTCTLRGTPGGVWHCEEYR